MAGGAIVGGPSGDFNLLDFALAPRTFLPLDGRDGERRVAEETLFTQPRRSRVVGSSLELVYRVVQGRGLGGRALRPLLAARHTLLESCHLYPLCSDPSVQVVPAEIVNVLVGDLAFFPYDGHEPLLSPDAIFFS